MNERSGRQILLVSFFLALAIVTYQEVHDAKVIPRPKRYISAALVYGILGIAAPFITYPVAGALGTGMVLTLIYQHYKATSTLSSGDVEVGENGRISGV